MPIKVICVCGKKFSVNDELAGKKVKCPACQKVLNLSKATAEKLSPIDRRDFEQSANNDPGNRPDQALEQFIGRMSSGADGTAKSKKKTVSDDTARRKKQAVSEPYDPCSAQLQSVRASKVREGISCYFFGFLVIFFAGCWAAYVPTLYQGDVAKVMRVFRGVSFVSLIAEVIITIGFGLCLTAPSKIWGRDSLFVAVISGLLGLLIASMTLWNPLYSLRIGRWLPQLVLATTHVSFFLFLRWLGKYLGRSEITSRATRVLVLIGIGAAIWLGVFRAQQPMPFMVMRNPFLMVLLFGYGIVGLIGLFIVIRLLSRCREILRTDERVKADTKPAKGNDSDEGNARWLSRPDVLKLAIGGGLASLSLWGWMALYKPAPARIAFPAGIPAVPGVAPAKPTIATSPGKKLLTLAGHQGMVSNVAFNSDWTRLATASWDKTIKVWDGASAKELFTLTGHSEAVRRVAFSPDGLWLASASADKSVKLWDAAQGKEQRTMTGHAAAVVSVAFSPDGKRLASVSEDKTVKVWNVATGRELLNLAGHTTPINVVAFSPDGQRLASAATHVKVWDAINGRELFTLKGHTSDVVALAFCPDGQQLASGSVDSTVKLWDITSGWESQTLRGHQSMIQGLAYQADASRLFSLGVDMKLKEWDLASGELRRTIQSPSSMGSLTLSGDGKRIAAASQMGAVEIWDELLNQKTPARSGHSGTVTSVAFSPDGQSIASASTDQTVKIWSVATGQEKQTLKDHAGTISAVAFRADGKSLVSLVSGGFGQKWHAKVWDLGRGRDTHTFPVNPTGIIAINAEGTRLASAFSDFSVKVWNLENDRELLALKGHSWLLTSLAFSRDGKWMATAGMVLGKPGTADYLTQPGEIRVWDASSGQESRLLRGQTAAPLAGVAISPDGTRLASSQRDAPVFRAGALHQEMTLKLWDAHSGQELHSLKGTAGAFHHLLFSHDGKHLACASPRTGDITLVDATTGQALRTLKGHTHVINGLAFSPDDTRLGSASNDETIRVWDTTTGRELLMLGVPAQ